VTIRRPWAWVAALVVVSACVRIGLGRLIVVPWIMVDELVYSELAKSLADGGSLMVREAPARGYGFVYPALLAPAWRAFASVPDAYAVAKAINAVVMSLTAVPAYLLARRVLTPARSLVVAALAVMVPSMLYTGTLMTENAFYPLFLLVALALVLMLERPTPLRQIAVLAACGLAFATRAQAVALVGAVAVAPLLWRGRPLRAYAWLYGLLAGAVVVVLAIAGVRGESPLEVFGAYRAAVHSDYGLGEIARYVVYHVAELDLYVGVIPFAALLALWLGARGAEPAVRAFAAASVALAAFLTVEVAAFASQPSVARVEERDLFYVVPLGLVALLVPSRVGSRARIAVAAVAAVLPLTLPYGRLFAGEAVADTLALLPWWWAHDRFLPLAAVRWAVLVAAAAAAAVFVLASPRTAVAVVAAVFVVTTAFALVGRHGMRSASTAARTAGLGDAEKDWVDRAVGRDADVAVVWNGAAAPYTVWEPEIFNRSVGTVYDLGAPLPGGLAETPVRRRADGVLVTGTRPVRAAYALADASLDLDGRVITRDGAGQQLVRVDGPLTVLTETRGLYPSDTWSGAHVTYTRLRCDGGRLRVTLASDPELFRADQQVTATVAGRDVARASVPPTGTATMTVPLRAQDGRCVVRFRVARTVVPARVVAGSTDERELGVHFLRLERVAG